jgi:hypothetical protein
VELYVHLHRIILPGDWGFLANADTYTEEQNEKGRPKYLGSQRSYHVDPAPLQQSISFYNRPMIEKDQAQKEGGI